ncbi:hypothetical protein WDZ92_15630, partial [Nostoc sp. NIES-2111]
LKPSLPPTNPSPPLPLSPDNAMPKKYSDLVMIAKEKTIRFVCGCTTLLLMLVIVVACCSETLRQACHNVNQADVAFWLSASSTLVSFVVAILSLVKKKPDV